MENIEEHDLILFVRGINYSPYITGYKLYSLEKLTREAQHQGLGKVVFENHSYLITCQLIINFIILIRNYFG